MSTIEPQQIVQSYPRKRRRVGPYSRNISLGRLDKRTREGRLAVEVYRSLTEQIGNPTAAQQLLIRMSVILVLRISLLAKRMGDAVGDDHQMLAWMNALQRNLTALGLEERLDASVDSLFGVKTFAEHVAEKRGEVLPEDDDVMPFIHPNMRDKVRARMRQKLPRARR